ncbi:ABC-2 family transporter protein [Paenibacillus sp. ACRRX]|uniref:ABC transporter permease n=1 Tax=Paenibacillus sp. ACRRX TaxID=2918206 RepID=UPI001EF678BC|nr:ABC-2 family transporter protein [Paenibacillus sp. ACRRX]MCG7408504.1 ABC-2 family transporter protein [Paenibacillus sp. ACRRX]
MNKPSYFSTFLVISRQSFLNSLVFRANYFIDLITEFILVLLGIILWKALYNYGGANTPISLEQLVAYMALSRIIVRIDMEFVAQIQQKVLNGEIAGELLRPIPLKVNMLFQEVGRFASTLLMRTLPIFLTVSLWIGVSLPKSFGSLFLFIISLFFSFLLVFYLNYIVALMAFWVTNLFSLSVFKDQTIRLLSGTLIPLWFFPKSLVAIVYVLPFAGIVFVPINIYLGNFDSIQSLKFIAIQVIWIVVFELLSKWVWKRAVQRICVNGG